MKILIVGLGSMGKRRARLTKGIDSSIRIAGVDTAESRRVEAADLGLIDPDAAFAHGNTYQAHPLGCAAALANLDIISVPRAFRGDSHRVKITAQDHSLKFLSKSRLPCDTQQNPSGCYANGGG